MWYWGADGRTRRILFVSLDPAEGGETIYTITVQRATTYRVVVGDPIRIPLHVPAKTDGRLVARSYYPTIREHPSVREGRRAREERCS